MVLGYNQRREHSTQERHYKIGKTDYQYNIHNDTSIQVAIAPSKD